MKTNLCARLKGAAVDMDTLEWKDDWMVLTFRGEGGLFKLAEVKLKWDAVANAFDAQTTLFLPKRMAPLEEGPMVTVDLNGLHLVGQR